MKKKDDEGWLMSPSNFVPSINESDTTYKSKLSRTNNIKKKLIQ